MVKLLIDSDYSSLIVVGLSYQMNSLFDVHDTADIAETATIGAGSKIWNYAQLREGSIVGENCVVGRGAYIDVAVVVGDHCKIQNHAMLYQPATLGDGVFIGPGAILTNDTYPRAVNPDGSFKSGSDWTPSGVTVGNGASIGAHATIVGPVTVGAWAVIGAGAVVSQNVPDYALVVGVPAKRIGWVGRAGRRLEEKDGLLVCKETGDVFRQRGESLEQVSTNG